jgi:SARP family transcriptional regulator, regulator of embCAB operon
MLAHTAFAEAEIACGRGYAVIGELELLTTEHPYREPLWAQLITAYYLTERQSDALDAYRRLKSTLADDLGIDPGPTVQALHGRVLRQEPLDVKRVARTTAIHTATALDQRTAVSGATSVALLRDAAATNIRWWRPLPGSDGCPTTTSFSTTRKSAATTPSSSTPAPAS